MVIYFFYNFPFTNPFFCIIIYLLNISKTKMKNKKHTKNGLKKNLAFLTGVLIGGAIGITTLLKNKKRKKKSVIINDEVDIKIKHLNFSDTYYNNKGMALNNLGRFKDAIAMFDKSLEINSKNDDSLYNRGFALGELGRYLEEIEMYDRILEMDSEDYSCLNNKGVSLSNLGRYQEAVRMYDQALQFDSNNYLIVYNKACAYALWGQKDKAAKFLRQVISMDSQYRMEAMKDKDFDDIKSSKEFKEVVGV